MDLTDILYYLLLSIYHVQERLQALPWAIRPENPAEVRSHLLPKYRGRASNVCGSGQNPLWGLIHCLAMSQTLNGANA
jgi:hypothetical protein